MKKEVTLLIGLPGSGKSYWIKQNLGNKAVAFDDISQTDRGLINLTLALNNPTIERIYIADVNFLMPNVIEKAQEKLIKLTDNVLNFSQVIFLGDYETCQSNVELRNDGRNVSGTLSRFKDSLPELLNRWQNKPNTTFIQVKNFNLGAKKKKI